MMKLSEICTWMESFAPLQLAESWDNTGLLIGSRGADVSRLMTCLTVTPKVVREAVDRQAHLIVSHHPIPFAPLKKITSDTTTGRLLLELIAAGIGVYSPHTAFDSTRDGINQRLAHALGLENVAPLVALKDGPHGSGAGRVGQWPQATPLVDCVGRLKCFLGIDSVRIVGDPQRPVRKVAIGCGAADQFLSDAVRQGCDLMVTGEARFHTCLEAEACDTALLLLGHFASERFAVEALADLIGDAFPKLDCWVCEDEHDPLVAL